MKNLETVPCKEDWKQGLRKVIAKEALQYFILFYIRGFPRDVEMKLI